MARTYRAESRTVEVVDKVTCDRCGDEIPTPGRFEVSDHHLSFTNGEVYPEGGSSEGWGVDLCDACIAWLKEKLISDGVKVRPVSIDW